MKYHIAKNRKGIKYQIDIVNNFKCNKVTFVKSRIRQVFCDMTQTIIIS